jgi:hypothetical protein
VLDNIPGKSRQISITAKIMKNLYPIFANPTGVISTTRKLNTQSVPDVRA